MKKLLHLTAGLAFILLATSASPYKANKPANHPGLKKNQTDSYTTFFSFTATPVGSDYRIEITFNLYDITTNTVYPGSCPENVSIKLTSGPYSGTSFTFPSGTETYDLGTLAFPSDPGGSNYPISTNPTTIDGYTVTQTLYGGEI